VPPDRLEVRLRGAGGAQDVLRVGLLGSPGSSGGRGLADEGEEERRGPSYYRSDVRVSCGVALIVTRLA
jgi:hypothetical protein